MDPYMFGLVTGSVGLGAMAVSGLAAAHGAGQHHDSGGHHGHHGGHGQGGHGQGGHGQGGHGQGGHGGGGHHGSHDVGNVSIGHAAGPSVTGHGASSHAAHASATHAPAVAGAARGVSRGMRAGRGGGRPGNIFLILLSPRLLFSVALGFGATGLLLGGVASGVLLFALAVLGGVLFETAIVRPLWNLLARFESAPAMSLESTLMDEARAVSRFDAAGYGLVAVELNGQVVQVLGTLRADDRALGVVVRAGDRVRIEDVDPARNRCTVAWLGP